MDALEAVLTRHSVPPAFLAEPAPDDATLERILAAGASAPDHGRLRPWRFIVIRGPARARLGEVFAEALVRRQPDAPAPALEQERARPLRAPLLIVVGARLEPQHPKIPEIEQILSTAAAAQSILIAAHALGYGAKWLTFPTVMGLIALTIFTVAYPTIKERMGKAKYDRPEDAI